MGAVALSYPSPMIILMDQNATATMVSDGHYIALKDWRI
jgi:hypothetical protein